jgi:glutamine synthetase
MRCTVTATANDIMQRAQQQQVEFISLQFTDIAGMLKNVTIPVAMLADCLDHGVWFDGSASQPWPGSRNRYVPRA